MFGEFVSSVYIGCATDSGYVMPTCAMLSSVDDNADLAEAIVIVGDFGLTDRERDDIRLSAGRLGERLRFLPLNRESPEFHSVPAYSFPLPLMTRLALPRLISEPRSRLVTLDSDMLVNGSLRPLFEISMRGMALGAVQDPISVRPHHGREMSHDYFNAGMLLIDIEMFNAQEIGEKAMKLLASYDIPPMWLDQDVLNIVLDGKWLNLDRRWNCFHAGDPRTFTLRDYERADVIHFAGGKPWNPNGRHHPARPLYELNAERAADKRAEFYESSRQPIDRVFAATCYEVMLGRQMESDQPYQDRKSLNRKEFAKSIRMSPEFDEHVIRPLWRSGTFPTNRFQKPPTLAQRLFVAEYLGASPSAVSRILKSARWKDLITALVSDSVFMDGEQIESLGRKRSA